MSTGEIILYQSDDGLVSIKLRAIEGTVWLTQEEVADLFSKGRSTITEHMQNILSDGEVIESSVCRNFRRTARDGKEYSVLHYNLDMILAVGYRVRSPRGTQFRKWANTVLKEYLIKGFVMNDERLKQADQWDYFDEWLTRIRDIRASEKRFYQKMKDLFTTAVDYDKSSKQAQLFFKKVQNKMLWAVTGQTAAEILENRSDPTKPNMGLTSWQGKKVRKGDVITAKNYLQQDELEKLNRIVTMYLDYAEEQARNRKTINMLQWEEKLDAFLKFNEHELLTHAGKVQMEVAEKLALEKYNEFDNHRKKSEALAADMEDFDEIEKIIKDLEKQSKVES